MAVLLPNEEHVTNPFEDFTVYYQDGVNLYECFPDRSRQLIDKSLSSLLDQSRKLNIQ